MNDRLKLKAFLVCLALLAAPAGRAERVHPSAGTSSANFLKVEVGARPAAMGGAFTAVADDVNAIYWNPAGLAGTRSRLLGYSHHESYQGLRNIFLGYVHPWRNDSVLGWGFNSQFVPGDLEKRSGLNEADPLNPITQPEGTFGAYDLALSFSYARKVRANHYLGSTVKFIHQDIGSHVGHSGALDLGWKWIEAFPDLSFGASILNIGPGVKFQRRYDLPLTLRAGTAYRLKPGRALLAFDVSMSRDNYPLLAWGLETGPWSFLVFRTGYQYRWYGNPAGALSGWRVGLGIVDRQLSLDYAVAPFGQLGLSHRISLGWRLGPMPARSVGAPVRGVPARTPPQKEARVQVPLPPPLPSLEEKTGGRTFAYSVSTTLKTLSGRGAHFAVRALAPSEEPELRAVRFWTSLPSATDFSLQVSEIRPPTLAGGLKARKAYRLRLNPKAATHDGFLLWDAGKDSGLVLMGSWGREWKRLKTEPAEKEGAGYLRVRFDDLPHAVAAYPGSSRPKKP